MRQNRKVNTKFEKETICLPEIIILETDSLQPLQQKKIENKSTKNIYIKEPIVQLQQLFP